MSRLGDWGALERPRPDAVTVDGVALRRRSRVRLRPRPGGDVLDAALDGRLAVVDAIEQDVDGTVQLAVTVDDDLGRDLGGRRRPGHRLFFAVDEVEPLAGDAAAPARVLVAGIGNVFLGDDGFGVALAERLARAEPPAGVEVVDYGIRGIDLAYALLDGWDAAILLDATPRGGAPGTLYVIEPRLDGAAAPPNAHGMDPVAVLATARSLGGELPRVLVVGCEPGTRMPDDAEEVVAELSPPVRGALDEAERLVGELLAEIDEPTGGPS